MHICCIIFLALPTELSVESEEENEAGKKFLIDSEVVKLSAEVFCLSMAASGMVFLGARLVIAHVFN